MLNQITALINFNCCGNGILVSWLNTRSILKGVLEDTLGLSLGRRIAVKTIQCSYNVTDKIDK